MGSGSLLYCKSLSLCFGVGLLSSHDISGWLVSVTMPTSVDGSKVCFWRLYSNSWMKSDPLSGDPSDTSKSGITLYKNDVFVHLICWTD